MSLNKYGEAWEEQETSIKWRDDMVFKLISLRQKYNNVFSGKRGSARDGWTTIAAELGLIEHNYKVLQKKWQNLVQKYKEVKSPANHPTNTEQLTTTWIFYNAMDQVLGDPEVANNTLFDTPRAERNSQPSDCDTRQIIDFDISDLHHLVQETPEQPFKKKKLSQGYEPQEQTFSTQSVQYVDTSQPPQWFRDFLTTYRQDEAKRVEALKSMHYDIMRLERKKCALLQELISKLSSDDDPLSDSFSNVSKTGALDQPTSTLTVTMDQADQYQVESASAGSQEPDGDAELNIVRAADDLENAQIIIKPEHAQITELVPLSQSGKAQSVAPKSLLSSGSTPVKLVVSSHAGALKGGQPLLIKTTTSRGKILVPMRRLVVPANEKSSSVCLGSSSAVLTDGHITAQSYQSIDTSDSG